MTDSEAVAALRTALKAYLGAAFGGYEVDQDDDFVVSRGSARVWVRPLEQEGRTFVVIWSVTNVGVPITGELTTFLAAENAALPFGKFGLNEQASSVQLVHTLLGDFLNREELEVAVDAVADTADQYDDQIKARFGGRLPADVSAVLAQALAAAEAAAETPETPEEPEEPEEPPSESIQGVRTLFGFLALVAAVGGAIYAYTLEGSVWLSLFVAVFAVHLVGRAGADLVTDPDKLQRALYFLLLPALATAVLATTHALWETWWLSTLLGLVGGIVLNAILAPRLFPRVHREETLDSAQRLATQRRPASGG